MNILVIGGFGLVGRNVVARLRAAGHVTTAASRSTGVDLTTGKGLAHALSGIEVVVDVSNAPSFDDVPRSSSSKPPARTSSPRKPTRVYATTFRSRWWAPA